MDPTRGGAGEDNGGFTRTWKKAGRWGAGRGLTTAGSGVEGALYGIRVQEDKAESR